MKKVILYFGFLFFCVQTISAQRGDSLITILQNDLSKQINSLRANDLNVAVLSDSLGKLYVAQGKYLQAKNPFEKALSIRMDKMKKNHPDLADSYCYLGDVYYHTADFPKAFTYYTKAHNIRLEVLGDLHLETSDSYMNIGNVYFAFCDYDKALEYSTKALHIRKEVLGEKHALVGASYRKLGSAHALKNDYDQAIIYYNKALDILLKDSDKNNPLIAKIYSNLGGTYTFKSDYEKAIIYYNKGLEIRLKSLDEGHPDLAISYDGLGNLYEKIGEYEKAFSYLHKSLDLRLKVLDNMHPSISESYNYLGRLYSKIGDNEKAVSYLNKTLEIEIEVLGETHPHLAEPHNSLGEIYFRMAQYEKAIDYYKSALNIRLATSNEKSPALAVVYNNLGLAYTQSGEFEKAIAHHDKALAIRYEFFSEQNPNIIQSYINLADAYEGHHQYETADSLWHLAINQTIERLNDTYLFLTDDQRLSFAKEMESTYNNFLSFTANNGTEKTRRLAASLLFNTKSLALDYSLSVRDLIKNMDNGDLTNLYDKLTRLNVNISQAELMTAEEREHEHWDLSSMRKQQETTAQKILENKYLKEKLQKTPVHWENAQNKLNTDEAIIDFVRFFEKSDKNWKYYAIVIRNSIAAPQFIQITNEKEISALLETSQADGYPKYIKNKSGLQSLYKRTWFPLMSNLKDVKTIHLSPAGLMHRIAFEALLDQNEKHLSEHYEFRYYTNMRNFIEKEQPISLSKAAKRKKYKTVVLFGDIQYDSSSNKTDKNTKDSTFRAGIAPLPSSKEEINEASKIVRKNGGTTVLLTGSAASEKNLENYTRSETPDIYHFATHAKYLYPVENVEEQSELQRRLSSSSNPLQRSMLMLSGANEAWTSKEYIPRSGNDGILTAYEVTHLDFSGTDLVVLSACNTGLGDIHDTEGVLGLQSAFKLAGVDHVVVSLWNVNDAATKNLMIRFYKNLLNKKQDAPTALQLAKNEMRNLGTKPINWAGFVLR